jgi:hypothetical protein
MKCFTGDGHGRTKFAPVLVPLHAARLRPIPRTARILSAARANRASSEPNQSGFVVHGVPGGGGTAMSPVDCSSFAARSSTVYSCRPAKRRTDR